MALFNFNQTSIKRPMKNLNLIALLIIITSFLACSNSSSNDNKDSIGSVLILNQGGFNRGEASITKFDPETGVATQNAFATRNGRPLGDVLQSATIQGDKLYLVVNNSRKIEVVNASTLASISTINLPNTISPRYLATVSEDVGFITSLFTDYVYEINLSSGAVTDSVEVGGWTEDIKFVNGRLFVAKNPFASDGITSEVVVINAQTKQVEKRLETLPGPQRFAVIGTSIWVNCSGSFGDNNGGIVEISLTSTTVLRTISFNASTSGITASGTENALFVLSNGIVKVPLNDVENRTLVSDNRYYAINIDERNDFIIYASDAKNFTQRGTVYMYNKSGIKVDSLSAGIVPYDVVIINI
jgi:hypothetical protein